MARVTYTPVVAGVSGKAADAVFSSWKGRGYIRKLVTPSNPKSAAQTVVRESMARIPPLWRSLEAEIKTLQNSYAAAYRMSGYNWFAKNNRKDEEANESYLVTPPNIDIDPPATITLTDSGGGVCKVDWTGGTIGANYFIYILTRLVEPLEVVNKYSIESKIAVLSSAGTHNATIAASKDSIVVIAISDNTPVDFSESIGDKITMGA